MKTRFRKSGELNQHDTKTLNRIMGRRMLIKGTHPWAGHTGEVTGAEHTPVGWGIRLRLDNGIDCLVMDAAEGVLL